MASLTINEVVAAWAAAEEAGADFYAEFERRTGISETKVKEYWETWSNIRHETAESFVRGTGQSMDQGFLVLLASVLRLGRLPIEILVDPGYPPDPNPRLMRPWPKSEDCPGCDGRVGPSNTHRFGCSYGGARGGHA